MAKENPSFGIPAYVIFLLYSVAHILTVCFVFFGFAAWRLSLLSKQYLSQAAKLCANQALTGTSSERRTEFMASAST